MKTTLTILIITAFVSSCTLPQGEPKLSAADLDDAVKLMTGTFTSAIQAQTDSAYYNISLTMHPIWKTDPDVRWLYVEQAVTKF